MRPVLDALLFLALAAPANAQQIITREQWGAAAPVLPMKPHNPDRITVHHTASPMRPKTPLATKLKALQTFSQSAAKLADGRFKKQWADIPYHYYIAADGQIAEARDVRFVGDTNTNYDPTGHITIVVEGNFETQTPPSAGLESLRALIIGLSKEYGVHASRIGVHSDFAHTACPGAHLIGPVRSIAAEIGGG